jgi:hypothetical protein
MVPRRCACCGLEFLPHPQSPQQTFCAASSCQRERRRRWQKAKRSQDEDYRSANAADHRLWLARHPDYWREYRSKHPEYVAANRAGQRLRDQRRRHQGHLANEDVSGARSATILPFPTGTYRLLSVPSGEVTRHLANEDAWTVEIRVVSAA